MTERDARGRFVNGNSGGPGRPQKDRETRYYEIMMSTCSYADWEVIIRKAVTQAKRGDKDARKWLADRLMGTPVQRQELTGADGQVLTVELVWSDGLTEIPPSEEAKE